VNDPYRGREQTRAKHQILKAYLQGLSFKILNIYDEIIFIDGFSGPWKERTPDLSDTSFRIAIETLKDVQKRFYQRKGEMKSIKCFLIEKDKTAYKKLNKVVQSFQTEDNKFTIKTFHGEFEEVAPNISPLLGKSFTLTFIDPTGWTGYNYEKIQPLLKHVPGEVLINFMYDFVNRASGMGVMETVKSLQPILGPNFKERMDSSLSNEKTIEQLFRCRLKEAGAFEFVASAQIKRATADRTQFFIMYGTRKDAGLVEFREVEARALQDYSKLRLVAKQGQRELRTGNMELFPAEALPEARSFSQEVEAQKELVADELLSSLASVGGQVSFRELRNELMQRYSLRETDIKNVCVKLAKAGQIEATWKERGKRLQKPDADAGDIIRLKR